MKCIKDDVPEYEMRLNDGEPSKKLMQAVNCVHQAIAANKNKVWKTAISSLHYQYNELVIWVYMFKREDIFVCYEKTLEIYKANQVDLGDLDINAYFYAKKSEGRFQVFSFYSIEDFLNFTTTGDPVDLNTYDEVVRDVSFFGEP